MWKSRTEAPNIQISEYLLDDVFFMDSIIYIWLP